MVDAAGFGMFMAAATELAGGAITPSVTPVWERERLCTRVPPRVTFDLHEYIHDDPPTISKEKPPVQLGSFDSVFFTVADVATLRAQLPTHLRKAATSYEILAACLWRCRTVGLRSAPDELMRLIVPANFRGKLNPPLPQGFYGNSFVLPVAMAKAGKLVQSNLGYAVELVREAKARVADEYVRSTVDFLVLNRRMHYVVANSYMVTDIRRAFDLQKLDWGWGKPAHIGLVALGEELISFLLAFKNSAGDDGVLVPINLPEAAMERFKVEIKKMVSSQLTGDVLPSRRGKL